MAGLVAYPFRLRPERWVTLMLPADLTRDDVERLIALLKTIVVRDE